MLWHICLDFTFCFCFIWTFTFDWPDWLSSRTPHQTCTFSPWSGWHAECRPGPPLGPSEPPSNDEEKGKRQENEKRGAPYEWVLSLQAETSQQPINVILLLSITVESCANEQICPQVNKLRFSLEKVAKITKKKTVVTLLKYEITVLFKYGWDWMTHRSENYSFTGS